MRRYTISDAGAVTKLMRSQWDEIRDDSFSIDHLGEHIYNLFSHKGIYALGRNPKQELFVFFPLNHVSCQVHVMFRHDATDRISAGREAVGWMYDNTHYSSISAFAPRTKREIRLFATLCGMKRVGVLPKSFQRDNIMYDQIIYQCTEEDYRGKVWQQR